MPRLPIHSIVEYTSRLHLPSTPPPPTRLGVVRRNSTLSGGIMAPVISLLSERPSAPGSFAVTSSSGTLISPESFTIVPRREFWCEDCGRLVPRLQTIQLGSARSASRRVCSSCAGTYVSDVLNVYAPHMMPVPGGHVAVGQGTALFNGHTLEYIGITRHPHSVASAMGFPYLTQCTECRHVHLSVSRPAISSGGTWLCPTCSMGRPQCSACNAELSRSRANSYRTHPVTGQRLCNSCWNHMCNTRNFVRGADYRPPILKHLTPEQRDVLVRPASSFLEFHKKHHKAGCDPHLARVQRALEALGCVLSA